MEIFKDFLQILAKLIRILKNITCFTSLNEELSEEFEDGPDHKDNIEILTPSWAEDESLCWGGWSASWLSRDLQSFNIKK